MKFILCYCVAVSVTYVAACDNRAQEVEGTRMGERVAIATQAIAIADSGSVLYDSVMGGAPQSRPVSWRELTTLYSEAAGLYQIVQISGAIEPRTDRGGVLDGFTYITLALVDDWSGGAPGQVVARVEGGPLPNGGRRSSPIAVTKGDVLGVLWATPRAENKNYHQLDDLAVFRLLPSGGYSNGQLFTQTAMNAAALKGLISQTRQGRLAADILPDTVRPPAPSGPVAISQGQFLAEKGSNIAAAAAEGGAPSSSTPTTSGRAGGI